MYSFLLILLVLIASVTHATTHRVPEDFNTIQSAILAAGDGDTVLVAEGTYVENIDFRGRNIVVGSHFLIDSDIEHVPLTVIDGSQPAHSDTGSVVRIISGEDTTAALIGFTLTGGTGTKFRDQSDNSFYVEGGGIIIENSDPLIAYNLIIENEATREPAGVISAGGGAIRYGYCAPRIYNNVILNNSGRYGGGIVSFFADGDIRHNVIANNDGGQDYGGGGVWIGGTGHTTILINNTIVGNSSVLTGGGVRLFAGVLNGLSNIVWGNQANSGTDQVAGAAANIHLDYNCVEGNLGGTGNINEYPEFLSQNLRLGPNSPCVDTGHPDPQWNDEDETRNDMGCYGGPGATWYPIFGEPVISMLTDLIEFTPENLTRSVYVSNSGTSDLVFDSIGFAVWDEALMIDRNPTPIRPVSTDSLTLTSYPLGDVPVIDTLLVYHNALNTQNPVRIPFFAVGVSADEFETLPRDFALHPVFPNPFNPATTISFDLPSDQFVNLTISDIQGREVAQLLQSRLPAGEHAVVWDAARFASGTYFAQVKAGKWQSLTKLVLLK